MFDNILLTVDLDDECSWRNALPVAVEICKHQKGTLHVLTVVPDVHFSMISEYFPAGYEQRVREETRQRLHDLVKEQVAGAVPTQCVVGQGKIYEEIMLRAERLGVNLIVMASHRPGPRDYLIGPNASKVVRHFPGSVMVVRPGQQQK